MLSDPVKDSTGSRDIVGNSTNSAAYLFNDGNYIYFRMRVDANPLDNSGIALGPFGWGFLLDTNNSLDDYEYMIMLDGINNPDVMYLARNTVQGTLGDPSDKAEMILWQEDLNYGANFRALGPLDFGGPSTNFGNDGDYFLDYYIPYNVFKNSMALNDSSVIRYIVGSSNSAQSLTADLVAGTTLYDSSSNFVMPSGKQPTTGMVSFVANSAGNIVLNEFYAENPAYLKVIDGDQNKVSSTIETVTVLVTAPSGDSQSVTLTETGADTGIFVGPLDTLVAAPLAGDGKLQVSPIEIVTVTYIDAADGNLPPLLNQTHTDTARVLPAADIAVTKSVDDPTPVEGQTIVYTVNAENIGPSSAGGVQISDLLPAGVTYVSHSAPAGTSYNPVTGLWTAGTVIKNQIKTLSITAIVNNGTYQSSITNTATRITASQPDPNPTNDSASASIAVTGSDLTVSKSASNLTPAVGGTITFTITVVNSGSNAATNLVITDVLPLATWSNVNITSTSHGNTSYSGGNLLWTIGTLPHPGTATLTFNATLSNTVLSGTSVTNTAAISQVDQSDPNPTDDSASVTLIVGGIDLALAKVVTSPLPATPDVANNVVFVVTISNSATASTTATGVEITDILPNGLTYVSGVTTQGAYATSNGKWNVGSLAPGVSATLTLTATVDNGQAGATITNTANITGYNQLDVNTTNHRASASIEVRSTDLEIVKTVNNQTPITLTGSLIYTITVTNRGSLEATGVIIRDQLPGVTTLVTATASQGSYSATTYLWTVGTIAPGASAILTLAVNYTLGQNTPRTFFNTASLDSSTPGDSNAANNVSSVVVSVQGTDLGLAKTMNTGYTPYPTTGTATQFLLTITNHGPSTATGIVVKDVVPTGLDCTSGAPSAGTTFSNNGNACDWSIASLAVDSSATLVLTSNVTAATGTIRTNSATINKSNQADPFIANNDASQSVYIGASDLNLSKVVDNPTPNVGERVKFTITLNNDGPNSVGGIVVTDMIPAGLTLLTAAPYAPFASQGSYDSSTGIWTVGTVPYPGVATLELYATVNAGSAGSVIVNTAEISVAGALDPDASGNFASAAVTIPLADIYVTKEANTLTPYVGEDVTFTIVVGNSGPNDATNLVVRDLLASTPDSEIEPNPVFSNLVMTPSQGSYDPVSGDWSLGTLIKGSTATLTMTATVMEGSQDKNITNTASRFSSPVPDNNPDNDSATIIITPRLLPIDLEVTKTVDNSTPFEGTNVLFTVTLYNYSGSRTATDVVLTDILPPGLGYVSHVVAAGSITAKPDVGLWGDIIWSVPTLAPMSNVTLIITAKPLMGTGGTTLTNNVAITDRPTFQFDPNTANDSASVSIIPISMPNITVLKSVFAESDPVNGSSNPFSIPGAVMRYEVQVFNFGKGVPDAASIIINDPIPVNTALVVAGTPVTFVDGTPISGLSLSYGGLNNLNDSVSFCAGADCDYIPMISADNTDANVTSLRITPVGTMGFDAGSGAPCFKILFRVVIK